MTTKDQREALMELLTREDLIKTQTDKCWATVIWALMTILKKPKNQLNYKEFYKKLPTDPFEDQDTIMNSLNDLFEKLLLTKNS